MKVETKELGEAYILPFENYPAFKKQWREKHPKAKVIEEITSISMGTVEIPDPVLIGKTKTQQTIMIAWAIIFKETVSVDEPVKSLVN